MYWEWVGENKEGEGSRERPCSSLQISTVPRSHLSRRSSSKPNSLTLDLQGGIPLSLLCFPGLPQLQFLLGKKVVSAHENSRTPEDLGRILPGEHCGGAA